VARLEKEDACLKEQLERSYASIQTDKQELKHEQTAKQQPINGLMQTI
jgi:hypothetical protein